MMRPFPFVVVFVALIQLLHLSIELGLLPSAELLEARHRVETAYSCEADCYAEKDSSVIALLAVELLVESHVTGADRRFNGY